MRAAAATVAMLMFLTTGAGGDPLAGAALARALRAGGYVIVMRHASSPSAPPDRQAADPENAALERQLDETGRRTAREMGAAMRAMGIPVGAVLSSPTYRARETVRLAGLGTPAIFAELGDGGSSMSASAVAAWASWLKSKAAEPPRPRTDTVMVTQMPNIASAFAADAKTLGDGGALVFRLDGNGGVKLVARVGIADWPRLAAAR